MWQLVKRVEAEDGPEDLFVLPWGFCRIYATRFEVEQEFVDRLDPTKDMGSFRSFVRPTTAHMTIAEARSRDWQVPHKWADTLFNTVARHEPALDPELIARAWIFSATWKVNRESPLLSSWTELKVRTHTSMIQVMRPEVPIAVRPLPPHDEDEPREPVRPQRIQPRGSHVSTTAPSLRSYGRGVRTENLNATRIPYRPRTMEPVPLPAFPHAPHQTPIDYPGRLPPTIYCPCGVRLCQRENCPVANAQLRPHPPIAVNHGVEDSDMTVPVPESTANQSDASYTLANGH